ncbi:ABC transporter permease, partial [Dysosmobacter welbionis]
VTLLHDDAAVHEDHLVRHIPGKGHLMGDDNHGGPLFRQLPNDPKHLAGEFRVQGGGRLVKAEDVRVQGQGPGDGHPLLLSAGELAGVVICPLTEAHLRQQLPAVRLDLLQDLLFVLLEVRLLLGQQLPGQGDVLQRRVLGEQIEGLKHQPEVEPLLPHLALPLGGGISGVKNQITRHRDGTLLRLLQEIQAPQQGGFAGAGGADDGQGLALLQIKADVLQHPGGAEMLFNVMYFQNCHKSVPSLLKEVQLFFKLAQQHRDDAAED